MASRFVLSLLFACVAAAQEVDPCTTAGDCNVPVSLLQSGLQLEEHVDLLSTESESAQVDSTVTTKSAKKETQNPIAAAKAEALASPTPPISTANKCIIYITCQYFIVFTALAIARTYRTLSGATHCVTETILQSTSKTMSYGPMCAILFLTARMRANLLANNEDVKYNLPQPWCQDGMVLTTVAVAVGTLLHLFTEIAKETGRTEHSVGLCAKVIEIVRYLTLPVLYIGAILVTAGLLSMKRPEELEKTMGPVEMSDASYCTVMMTALFFIVHLGVQIAGTVDTWMKSYAQPLPILGKLSIAMETATTTVYFCPMLAILFMCSQMRCSQINKDGQPPAWASSWFFITVFAVLFQTIISICVPLVMNATVTPGELDGELIVKVENPAILAVLQAARWILNLGLYIGMFVVAYCLCTMNAPAGQQQIPLSTTSKCVTIMTLQYFFIFFFLWLCLSLRELGFNTLNFMLNIMTAAKETVMFAPMLAVQFLGTRVRALQISDDEGSPQLWVQSCMFYATFSLVVQILMVIITGLVMGKPVALDPSSKEAAASGGGSAIIGYVTTALQYLCMIAMYGGSVGVMIGLFEMQADNIDWLTPS